MLFIVCFFFNGAVSNRKVSGLRGSDAQVGIPAPSTVSLRTLGK